MEIGISALLGRASSDHELEAFVIIIALTAMVGEVYGALGPPMDS